MSTAPVRLLLACEDPQQAALVGAAAIARGWAVTATGSDEPADVVVVGGPQAELPARCRLLRGRSSGGAVILALATTAGAGEALAAEADDVLTALTATEMGMRLAAVERLVEARRGWQQAENLRRQSERRTEELVEQAADMMYVHRLDGRLTALNGAGERVTGYSRAELLSMTIFDLIVPGLHDQAREMTRRKLAGVEATTTWELEIVTRDGRVVPLEAHSRLVYEDGKPVSVQGVARDISARRAAETAQRAEAETFKLLFVRNPQPMWVYDNETLAFLEVNERAVAHYGYTRDEFLAMRLVDVRPAEDREAFLAQMATNSVGNMGEWRHQKKDGSVICVRINAQRLTFQGRPATLVVIDDVTAQRRAEEERARLTTVVEWSTDVIISRDVEGRYLTWNRGAEAALGYAAEEVLGRRPEEVFPDGSFSDHHWPRLMAGEVAEEAGMVRLTKDGRRLRLAASFFPLLNERGEVTGAAMIARDVTEQHATRAERALLAAIVSSSPDAVFSTDETGRVTTWNRGAERLFGRSSEGMLGTPIFAAASGSEEDVERTIAEVVAGRTVELSTSVTQANTGRLGPVSALIFPVFGTDGQMVCGGAIFRDLSEQRAAEDALGESEERYRGIYDNTSDMISLIRVESDGRFVYEGLNRAYERVSGLSTAVVRGREPGEIMPPKLAALLTGRYRRCLEAGHALTYEHELDLPANKLTLSTQLVPIRDVQGRICRLAGISRDITEDRRAQEERRRLDRRIQEAQKLEGLSLLAGGVAHDFNNLLVTILGNAGFALMDVAENSPTAEALHDIETAARRAADLTRQLMAYAGRGRLLAEPIDLSQVVQETGRLLGVAISPRAQVEYDLAHGLPLIEGDATQLRQVIMNLITNASDALGDDNGEIRIATALVRLDRATLAVGSWSEDVSEGEYVSVEVSDTGCGMDPETQARVFEPFFTTKFTGRGLGLAAVQGIVRGHGGAITIASQPGRGTAFRIYLPVRAAGSTSRESVEQRAGREQAPTSGRGGLRILVVDDDPGVREVTARMLRSRGFAVVAAEDGMQAVELFARDPAGFDAVLLDLAMPLMDGARTFLALRNLRPGVRVVIMSGKDDGQAVPELREGAAAFILKPFLPGDLVTQLLQAVGREARDACP
ncbi:MAG: PAS domain S-box protein [Gemmataceae bacterium]|nr:PAS domain S-box protein [Gemmataceae bacterium]